MESSLRRAGMAIAHAVCGAIIGGIAVTALLPYLRQVDPYGLSPVVLISLMGGTALGWYLRDRM